MKPNMAVVALLESLLDAARSGELQEVFAVFKCCDDSFDSCFDTDDLGDMLLQVRTEIIRAQSVTGTVDTVETSH